MCDFAPKDPPYKCPLNYIIRMKPGLCHVSSILKNSKSILPNRNLVATPGIGKCQMSDDVIVVVVAAVIVIIVIVVIIISAPILMAENSENLIREIVWMYAGWARMPPLYSNHTHTGYWRTLVTFPPYVIYPRTLLILCPLARTPIDGIVYI